MLPHLTVKSDYTFFEGASKIKDLVKRAKELGGSALALTDRDAMYGAYEFSKTAKSEGIFPIVGAQLPLSFKTEEKGKTVSITGYMVFLAQNEEGYRNICRMMSEAHRPKDDGSNFVPTRMLIENSEGVILLSGADDGFLAEMIRRGYEKSARQAAAVFAQAMPGRFYVQINRASTTRSNEEKKVERILLDIAKSTNSDDHENGGFAGCPIIATSEVRYTTEDRVDAYELLNAIADKSNVDLDGDRVQRSTEVSYHMRGEEEMNRLFADIPHAIENARQLPNRFSFLVDGRDPILPAYDTVGGRSEIDELKAQARDGLEARIAGFDLSERQRAEYFERLEYELGIIEGMGFPGYFLIVSDFIKWAKEQEIPVGPGRGSGAGSMVAWALLITDLDPFRFGLLFERFLNPDRVSMPDFDVDFCKERRDEVIQYVADKYGHDRVSQIATFGEIKSKAALKDVGRVLMHPQSGIYSFPELNGLTKLIPKQETSAEPQSLPDAYKNSDEFRDTINESDKNKKLFDNAVKVEGLYRNFGAHAAGILIGDQPLADLLPVTWDQESNVLVSQYNMKGAESVGLVKFDFLGLKTLSVIREALNHIRRTQNRDIDISAIPLDDADVYEMLAEGKSAGVFQFESGGMQEVLRSVGPTCIEDLIAVVSLYRPGPMDQIPHYAACKNGTATPHYPQPEERTKPFLEETFGIMVYQEQVMKVAQEVAGYSLGAADMLRRAMGKKIASEMDAQRVKFVDGATERGIPKKDANELFDTIAKFAGYGFNKSHAAAYAYIAYQTAWLKRHYPAEFYAALLSFETDNVDRMSLIKDDMEAFSIRLLPPHINRSQPRFAPEADQASAGGFAVRFGFIAIKQISEALGDFARERGNNGFADLKDFARRGAAYFGKSKVQKLAEAGCFDSLDENRRRAYEVISWHLQNEQKNGSQTSMFGSMLGGEVPESVLETKEWGNRFEREFNSVGFYFDDHPIDHYLPKLRKAKVRSLDEHIETLRRENLSDINFVPVCGIVDKIFRTQTQRGDPMLRVLFSDKTSSHDLAFFSTRGMSVNAAEEILRTAKETHAPVVLFVNLASKPGADRINVNVKKIVTADRFVSGIHGNISISVDMQEIADRPGDVEKKLSLRKRAETGQITTDEYKSRREALESERTRDFLAQLVQNLEGYRAGENDEGFEVTLTLQSGGKVTQSKNIKGEFVIGPDGENIIKSMSGVVSFSEDVTVSAADEDDGDTDQQGKPPSTPSPASRKSATEPDDLDEPAEDDDAPVSTKRRRFKSKRKSSDSGAAKSLKKPDMTTSA